MAGLLTAILLGYIGPVTGYLEQRSELREQQARLADLESRRDAFREQIAQLGQAPVLEARARELGLVLPGERAFLVRGDLDPPPPPADEEGDDGGPFGWFTAVF
jgi:cell division protein FtsB